MTATATKKHADQVLAIAKDLDLPLDAITERLGFLGQSGSGKTYSAMRLAELMLEVGAQIIAVDPVGPWWGLRSAADGKGPGFPVHVFGGIHGDVPLTPEAGALVADVLVDKGISAVLDVSDFTIGQMHHFLVDFAERFFDRKKRTPTPVHIFWEEAHTFVPQQLPPDPKAALMLNRVERIIRVGRNYGIGSSLISQMPQSVNKKSLNQIACLFAMRTLGPQERKAIGTWFDDKATSSADLGLADVLSKLETGEAYVASPAWLKSTRKVHLSRKTTFDSSATPKFGVKLEPPKVLAAVDVEALRSAMATVVDEAEKDDPKALRRRIAELERELKHKPAPKVERVEVAALKESELKHLEKICNDCLLAAAEADSAVKGIAELVRYAMKAAPEPRALPEWAQQNNARAIMSAKAPPVPPLPRPQVVQAPGPAAAHGQDVKLEKGAREILRMLVAVHPRSMTRDELGTLVGMRADTGHFGNLLGSLRSAQLIAYGEDGNNVATDDGLLQAGPCDLPTRSEVLARWQTKLEGGSRKMISAILERGTLSREQLGEAIGMRSDTGHFGNMLGALRGAGLVPQRGPIHFEDVVSLGGES